MRLILAPHIPPCWLLPTELLELSIRVLTPSPLLTLNAVLVRLQLKFEVVAVEMMDDDGHRLRTPSSSASYKWRFRCLQRCTHAWVDRSDPTCGGGGLAVVW